MDLKCAVFLYVDVSSIVTVNVTNVPISVQWETVKRVHNV